MNTIIHVDAGLAFELAHANGFKLSHADQGRHEGNLADANRRRPTEFAEPSEKSFAWGLARLFDLTLDMVDTKLTPIEPHGTPPDPDGFADQIVFAALEYVGASADDVALLDALDDYRRAISTAYAPQSYRDAFDALAEGIRVAIG